MTVFVTKGDQPLTEAQLEKRAQAFIDRDWPAAAREESIRKGDGLFDEFISAFSEDHQINRELNAFNQAAVDYRRARDRLRQPVAAIGAEADYKLVETGEIDAEGQPVTVEQLVSPAVAPLEPTIEKLVWSEDSDEPEVVLVTNPEITRDEEERAAAQAIVDQTAEEVVAFVEDCNAEI